MVDDVVSYLIPHTLQLAVIGAGNGAVRTEWSISFLMLVVLMFSCGVSHPSCSRVAAYGDEMFDFSCSLSHSPCSRVAFFHSSCTKAAVNRGWMIEYFRVGGYWG